jgi:hypothetical protein
MWKEKGQGHNCDEKLHTYPHLTLELMIQVIAKIYEA